MQNHVSSVYLQLTLESTDPSGRRVDQSKEAKEKLLRDIQELLGDGWKIVQLDLGEVRNV